MSDLNLADRQPPQSKEAEQGVLGSVLRDNAVLSDVLGILRPDNFYYDAHQKIFEAIVELYNAAKPVDAVILFENLKKKKQIDDVGGASYIAELWDAAPTAANAEYYANIVREKAVVRNLIHAHTELLRDSYDGVMSADELLSSAERKILEIAEKGTTSSAQTLGEAMKEAFDRMDSKAGKDNLSLTGVRTGYIDLDNLTAGLQNNELIIIAARPSVGKTAFALNLVRNVIVDDRVPVFFVSLEQAKIELAERLLVCQSRVDSHSIRTGRLTHQDTQKLMEAADVLRGTKENPVKLFLDDTPAQTLLRISSTARRLKLREGIRLMVIDYLQLIEPENKKDPRQEQVAQMSRRLKFLARELEIPVIALAQVNRGSEDRQDHTPRLADLRESGAIEQDADTVFMLHRPARFDKQQEDDKLEVHIAKQRNGPTGEITLSYFKQFMRYENYAADTGYRGG
ncbi:replicative DNA helicase [soil metagenome]